MMYSTEGVVPTFVKFFLQKDIFLSGHLITDDTLSVVLQEVVWVALHVDVVLLRIKKNLLRSIDEKHYKRVRNLPEF